MYICIYVCIARGMKLKFLFEIQVHCLLILHHLVELVQRYRAIVVVVVVVAQFLKVHPGNMHSTNC